MELDLLLLPLDGFLVALNDPTTAPFRDRVRQMTIAQVTDPLWFSVSPADPRFLSGREQHPGHREPRELRRHRGLQVCVPHVLRHDLLLLPVRRDHGARAQQQRPASRRSEWVGKAGGSPMVHRMSERAMQAEARPQGPGVQPNLGPLLQVIHSPSPLPFLSHLPGTVL